MPDGLALIGALAIDRPLDVEQGIDASNGLERRGEITASVLPCGLR
jgi:hypothetical protein